MSSRRRQFGAVARAPARSPPGISPLADPQLAAAPAGSIAATAASTPGAAPSWAPKGSSPPALLFAGPGAALASLTALWWLRPAEPAAPADPASPLPAGCRPTARRPGRRTSRTSPATSTAASPSSPSPRPSSPPPPLLSRNALRLVLARAEFERLLDRPRARGRPPQRPPRHPRPPRRRRRPPPRPRRAARTSSSATSSSSASAHGLPIPEPNERIGRYRPDMLWREAAADRRARRPRAHSTAGAARRRRRAVRPSSSAADSRSCGSPAAAGPRRPGSGSPPRSVRRLGRAARSIRQSGPPCGQRQLAEHLVAGGGVPGDVVHRPGLEVGRDAAVVGAAVEVGEQRPADAACPARPGRRRGTTDTCARGRRGRRGPSGRRRSPRRIGSRPGDERPGELVDDGAVGDRPARRARRRSLTPTTAPSRRATSTRPPWRRLAVTIPANESGLIEPAVAAAARADRASRSGRRGRRR